MTSRECTCDVTFAELAGYQSDAATHDAADDHESGRLDVHNSDRSGRHRRAVRHAQRWHAGADCPGGKIVCDLLCSGRAMTYNVVCHVFQLSGGNSATLEGSQLVTINQDIAQSQRETRCFYHATSATRTCSFLLDCVLQCSRKVSTSARCKLRRTQTLPTVSSS